MNRIIKIFIVLLFLIYSVACSNTALSSVKKYLDKYNNLDIKVINNIDKIVNEENMTSENANKYKSLFKKQYQNLKYEIINEEYNGDEALISVNITVFDYYSVQQEAVNYLKNNPNEFYNEDGLYDVNKFISFKLDLMDQTIETIDYSIDFYVVNTNDGWVVSDLSTSDIEKIHGIYNYESQ